MLSIDLLDINVWLAFADENHMHHIRARHYWETEAVRQVAFTRTTMLGLLRLLTNKVVMAGHPFTVAEAWSAYQSFRKLPEVVWIGDQIDLAAQADDVLAEVTKARDFTPLHWTDAHLAALARVTGCRLVSFDSDFRRYKGLAFLHLTDA